MSYMMVSAVSELRTRTSGQLTGLPVGIAAQLTVTMHSDLGEVFYATSSKIGFRTNRFIVCSIQSVLRVILICML